MNIPNDTGNMWRLDRYVEYYNIRHSQNDSDVHNLETVCQDSNLDTKVWMAFLYSTCYSVATTCFLFMHFPSIEDATESRLRQFWAEYKSKLIFQSDRKYVKNMNKFCDIVMSYKEKVAGRRQFEICEELGWNQTAIYKWFTSVYYCGRFSAMLFMEAVYGLMGKPLTQESYLDWNSCKTCSQGLLTISYQDDLVAEVKSRIYMLLQWGYNVLFEGLVISTITQGWLDFANSIKPQANTMFCYLNTPIETCIQQVRSRRESNGKSPEFNTDNTVNRVKSIQSTRDKLRNAGFWCVEGSSSDILHYLNQFFGIGGDLDV